MTATYTFFPPGTLDRWQPLHGSPVRISPDRFRLAEGWLNVGPALAPEEGDGQSWNHSTLAGSSEVSLSQPPWLHLSCTRADRNGNDRRID